MGPDRLLAIVIYGLLRTFARDFAQHRNKNTQGPQGTRAMPLLMTVQGFSVN
jgi:hypothetical protein